MLWYSPQYMWEIKNYVFPINANIFHLYPKALPLSFNP